MPRCYHFKNFFQSFYAFAFKNTLNPNTYNHLKIMDYHSSIPIPSDENINSIENILEQERLDKALGCVIGAFIGDTLGSAIEFKSVITQNMLRQALEMNGGVFGNGPGQVTDDSELAMCLLHGLADTAPLFSLESIASYYNR